MRNALGAEDVTVIGGGLAGMAASIYLARAGMRVLCIEAEADGGDPVGESLDWTAPDLLQALGLPMKQLLEEGIATYKRHIILKLRDGSERQYFPSDWLGRPPFNVELRTLHVDRRRLDQAIRAIFLRQGVRLLRDTVRKVETAGQRVTALILEGGMEVSTPWFIDATGFQSSLFPRAFQLKARNYGPAKVAIWDYFSVPQSIAGTTLHVDSEAKSYMEWIWQIPIHANVISVGYVAQGAAIKEKRGKGQSIGSIYKTQLANNESLKSLPQASGDISPRITSFRCRVYDRITGPNWVVIGEAAAMVDPMTSNGVTSALRHASEASSLIANYRNRKRLPYLSTAMYRRRVLDLARFFNSGIEKIIYDWPVRNCFGMVNAGDIYTVPAWSINALYSRLRPRGVIATLLFSLLLTSLRCAVALFHLLCRLSVPSSPDTQLAEN